MSVSIEQWCETVKRHPLKFRYEGLDGCHTDVVDAARADTSWRESRRDEYVQALRDEVDEAIDQLPKGCLFDHAIEHSSEGSDNYLHWLDMRHATHDRETGLSLRLDKLDSEQQRDNWAWSYTSDYDPAEWPNDLRPGLLENHPPVAAFSHAFEMEVELEDVFFICPSCGREPHEKDETTLNGKMNFHCGLCGASSQGEMTPEVWADALGVELWPFRKKGEDK